MTPSDAAWQQLIASVHVSGHKAALAITGGGTGAIAELLRVPGGSRLLIEAQVPYDPAALAAFLGFAPAQASSADTAIAMARSACARAAMFMPAATVVGLGATAALVSDRPRRGEHRFHLAFANSDRVAHCTGVLAKGRRDRAEEEDLVSRAIVLWLAQACGLAAPSPRSLLDADEHFSEISVVPEDLIDRLVAGEVDRVTVQPDGRMLLSSAPPPALTVSRLFPPVSPRARIAGPRRRRTPAAAPGRSKSSATNVDKLAADRRNHQDTGSLHPPASRRSSLPVPPPFSRNRGCFRAPPS